MQVRVLTYNIHKGIGGVDRLYRPQRIIETLQHYQADIIFLQEVDDGVPRSRYDRQADLFADALQMPYRAFQRNVRLSRGHYGNAILSRFPISDIENIDLTIPLKKKRRALFIKCHLRESRHQQTLALVNCHLGLAGFERSRQVHKILQNKSFKHMHYTTPTIIGGDYNDVWGSLGKQILQPAGYYPVSKKARTFPAFMPLRQLDNLYFRGPITLRHSFPGMIAVARQASDHLPLVADLDVEV